MPWVSPVACVPKKDEKMQDMRSPNVAIKLERHSTPTIYELMNDLNGATVFSNLDLNQGYNQLELEESSRYITKFSTQVGLRQYKRVNFGICSAAEVFQEVIRQALAGMRRVINLKPTSQLSKIGRTATARPVLHRIRQKSCGDPPIEPPSGTRPAVIRQI